MTISLKEVEIFAHHGLYPEERIIGNTFIVDLSVSFLQQQETISAIGETVNYAYLQEIVKQQMAIPRDLMETVAMDIVAQIRKEFPSVTAINISISKKSPPINNFRGKVGVSFSFSL